MLIILGIQDGWRRCVYETIKIVCQTHSTIWELILKRTNANLGIEKYSKEKGTINVSFFFWIIFNNKIIDLIYKKL